MANALWIGLVKPDRPVPKHLDFLIAPLTGADDNAYAGVSMVTPKANVTTAQNTRVDTFESSVLSLVATMKGNIDTLVDATTLSEGDKTALKAAIASEIDTTLVPAYSTLKTNLATDLNNNISNTASYNLTDALTQVKALFVAGLAAEFNGGTNFPDVRCKGTGFELDNAGNSVMCGSCDGLGLVTVENEPVTPSWLVNEEREF